MKHAKANIRGGHKHTPRTSGGNHNFREYKITGTWPDRPDRPTVKTSRDRAQAKRAARDMADLGAYVVAEIHERHGLWRVLYEIDGPAIVAKREAEQRAAELAEDERIRAELHRRAEARRAAVEAQRDRAQAAALMVQPPVPRTPAQRGARHTAGQR
jgi:hypothetical protein